MQTLNGIESEVVYLFQRRVRGQLSPSDQLLAILLGKAKNYFSQKELNFLRAARDDDPQTVYAGINWNHGGPTVALDIIKAGFRIAAHKGANKVIQEYLSWWPDALAYNTNTNGENPLMLAVREGHTETVQLLLRALQERQENADIAVLNTPTYGDDVLKQRYHVEMRDRKKYYDDYLTQKDAQGLTVFHLAACVADKKKFIAILSLLRAAKKRQPIPPLAVATQSPDPQHNNTNHAG